MVKQAKALLDAGYEMQDILQTIDYLMAHPPKDGIRSLGFVQYVINDVMFKIKVKELKEREIKAFEAVKANTGVPQPTTQDLSNAEKYLNKAKATIKGALKI
jgi:hypothetical protein